MRQQVNLWRGLTVAVAASVVLWAYYLFSCVDVSYNPVMTTKSNLTNTISRLCQWRPFGDRSVKSILSDRDDVILGQSCRKKTNFVFIKVHKAGGTAMCQLFYRFGLRHGLNFVLPNGSSDTTWFNLGWPYPLKESQYMRRINDEPFNILTNHAVYRRDVFHSIMPNDTVYLAILREPFSHLKSAMNYYALPGKYKLPRKNTLTAFLRQPSFYEDPWRNRMRQPFSHTNLMSWDMGINFSARLDAEYVEAYVTRLEREFMLVLILEYLDASLVLLKRYMCWDMVDILYKKRGPQSYRLKNVTATPELRAQHENWSRADYILYRHFNTSLWEKINREGRDFWAEVRTFRDMHERTRRFCHPRERSDNQSARLEFGPTPWSRRFHVDYQFCRLLRSRYAWMRNRAHVLREKRLSRLQGRRAPQNVTKEV
ncbi:PREDICTED: galactosylceramide sulfotransferase-like [Branchiostoma belcheri]|uniref:Galactosylceramide sulfotransferase-like n=1 Tax=Branchiostoma belcheri TaxID=7741 RepID=A0A6P4ZJG1_BRABE|nr:PREDICTED: galactosylceramide sulfotransferase-like [Branchiostoma belcheri]